MFLFKKNVFKVISLFVFLYISNICTFTFAADTLTLFKNPVFVFLDEVSLYNKTYNDKLFLMCGPRVSLFSTLYTNLDFFHFGVGGRLNLCSLLKKLFYYYRSKFFNSGQNKGVYVIPCGFFQLNFLFFDFYYCTFFLCSIDIIEIVQLFRFMLIVNTETEYTTTTILCYDKNKMKRRLIEDFLIPRFVFNLPALFGSLFS